jgi:hypothetical protein
MTKPSASILTRAFLLLLILCQFLKVNAQSNDSLLKVYNEKTIHSYGNSYIIGSKQLRFGQLKKEFTPGLAFDLYKKSRTNLRMTWLFSTVAVGSLVAAIAMKKDNRGASTAFSVLAIGLNLGAIHLRKKSSELVDQAIWHRNKEILFGVQE